MPARRKNSRRQAAPGHIERRGERFRAIIHIEGIRDSETFSSVSEATIWLHQRESDARSGTLRGRLLSETTTLREALERYAVEVSPEKKSGKSCQQQIRRMLDSHLGRLADKPLSNVMTSDIADYVARRRKAPNKRAGAIRGELVSAATINNEVGTISHLFNTAISRWGFDGLRNPVVRGVKARLPRGRDRRLEGNEEKRLLDAAAAYDDDYKSKVPMVATIRFAILTAMRQGEIGAIRPSMVNISRSSILLQGTMTKNGKTRSVALSPSARRLIAAMMPTDPSDDGLIFGSASAIQTAFKRIRDRAGLIDFRFHDLRHEATSRFFEETNLSETEISSITGHLTPQMLRRYAHLRTETVVAKLAESEARRSQLPQAIGGRA